MSDDERALLAAIKADPEDDTPRLVYADYVEEVRELPEYGYAIREEIALRRQRDNDADRDYDAYDRHLKLSRTIERNLSEWCGGEIGSWLDETSIRSYSLVGGMLTLRGAPCDLNKVPLSACPWVAKLRVRGEAGGAGGVMEALRRTGAVDLGFVSDFVGTRQVLERFVRMVKGQHTAHALRYLSLGVTPTDDTLREMVHWHHDVIKQMARVVVAFRPYGHRRLTLEDSRVRLVATYWKDISGREIFQIPPEK